MCSSMHTESARGVGCNRKGVEGYWLWTLLKLSDGPEEEAAHKSGCLSKYDVSVSMARRWEIKEMISGVSQVCHLVTLQVFASLFEQCGLEMSTMSGMC